MENVEGGGYGEMERSFQKEKRLRENFNRCTLSDDNNVHLAIKVQRISEKNSPVYSLTVCGDGRVVYEGFRNVKVLGTMEYLVEREKIKALLDKLEEIYFLSLSGYDSGYGELPATSGHDMTKISVTLEHDTKELEFPNDDQEYEVLIELGNLIDETVGSDRWVS